ncbi:ATP-binding protein [Prevotella sp.]|uniref:ATP-binding protein n=1 Tax=Prevotella sp. TaxID=59823 RepID=UPI003079AEB2
MKFVDRIEEQKRLHKCLHESADTGLSVIYGRRRLGKSTLIKRVFNNDDVYFMADNSESSQQRRLLARLLATKFEGFDKVEYPDWESLLTQANYRTNEKFCLCMDEFPLLVKSDRTLPSILQKLIDSKSLRYNIVLCGSSQQMMQGLVLDAAEPLYGRADNIIKLEPIHVRFLQEILQTNALNTVEEYAVWGGVPRYWELREKETSMAEAIKYNIVNVNGTLYEEPARLFMDDFQQTTLSSTLLSLIGNGVNKISEIAAKLGKPATELSRPLQKLTNLGFVEREIPYGESPRSSKRGVYHVADPFMCFFYRYVVPNRSLIALGRDKVVEEMISKTMNEFVANRWEILCRNAVSGNVVDGTLWNVAGRWWGSISREKSVELDIVAESMDRKKILIGECKWTEPDYAERLFTDLKVRSEGLPLIKGKEVVYCLFLKYPPKDGIKHNVFLPKNVVEDVFE